MTVMSFYNAANNGQTQSCSLGLRCAQNCCEGTFLNFLAHAATSVLELHRDVRCTRATTRQTNRAGLDRERAAIRHRLGGVEDQIQKRLFQLRCVRSEERRVGKECRS